MRFINRIVLVIHSFIIYLVFKQIILKLFLKFQIFYIDCYYQYITLEAQLAINLSVDATLERSSDVKEKSRDQKSEVKEGYI